MKTANKSFSVLMPVLFAMAESAYGTQPPDVVTSDDNENTAMGTDALSNLNDGICCNTAAGAHTLQANTTGEGNTAAGQYALFTNTTGYSNSAVGSDALTYNTTGNANTAIGSAALLGNTTGYNNTAVGSNALEGYYSSDVYDSTGSDNTAIGVAALFNYTTGSNNTASGYESLYDNTTGNYNNASGYYALRDNTTGSQNSASGVQALSGNKTGNYNTASGTDALYSNTSGSSNIAAGYKAGYNLTTGSNNIDIGNLGVAAESGTIRIGTTSTHTATYIAGIYGKSVTGSAVVVSSTGQLGVTVSSERFKTTITPMGSNSEKLQQLRPVTFHLKTDPKGALQYGLIAEEVAKVYPELVIRNESGRIDGVRYDELAPMLLNEMQHQRASFQDLQQRQQRKIDAQAEEIRALREQQHRDRQQQLAQFEDLKQELQAVLPKAQNQD